MSTRQKVVIAAIFIAVLVVGGPLIATTVDSSKPEQMTAPVELASRDASAFLERYVDSDGRVRVEGVGVSQAQAQSWGMLIAAATGSPQFDNIWHRYQEMVSSDKTSVTDFNAAWALNTAGDRLQNELYTATSANVVAEALLHPEASDGTVLDGLFFLGLRSLATGDSALAINTLAANQRSTLDVEMKRDDSSFNALPGIDGYVGDAQLTTINLATSCDAGDQARATYIWTKLRVSRDTRTASALSANGEVTDKTQSARAAAASAAAAESAGEQLQSLQLLQDADGIAERNASTVNAAWSTLGRVLLTTDWLGKC